MVLPAVADRPVVGHPGSAELVVAARARAAGSPVPRALVAAVTGTNGKTSVVTFTRQLLTAAGVPTASLSSLGLCTPLRDAADPELVPGAAELGELASDVQADGAQVLVLEAHSRALARGALDLLEVDVAACTNLTPDHLDVHGDMAGYEAAKRRLFTALLRVDGAAVVDCDEPVGRRLAQVCRERGVAEVVAVGAEHLAAYGTAVRVPALHAPALHAPFQRRNAALALQVAGVVLVRLGRAGGLGEALRTLMPGIAGLEPPPGRFERLPGGPGVEVVVDHGHGPGALAAVLDAVAADARAAGGRVLSVVGCGGDRDPTKRQPMGQIAAAGSDVVVVTDDNPRDEEPAAIRAEVLSGARSVGGVEVEAVADRRAAIARALALADPGDRVVVAGRGDESVQVRADGRRVPLDDRAVVRDHCDS